MLLGFIGVKLVLHALHENEVPFINEGQNVGWAPELPIWVSLGAIILILGVTTVASAAKTRRDARHVATSDQVVPTDDAEKKADPSH